MSREPGKFYQEMLYDLIQYHSDLAVKSKQYSEDTEDSLLHRTLMWLCQATYCLTISQFVAVTAVQRTDSNTINKLSIPWDTEESVRRLGRLVCIDPGTSEISISHSSVEEYFQSKELQLSGSRSNEEMSLSWCYVDRLKSQQYLAESGGWFLGCQDFAKPLIFDGELGSEPQINEFKRFPAGLGRPLNPRSDDRIRLMLERLEHFPGLEYHAINFHLHARTAAYLEYKATGKLVWVETILKPLVAAWILDSEEESSTSEQQYRSWQEVHAFYCFELPDRCDCEEYPAREGFLAKLRIRFLLGWTASTCLWCGVGLSTAPVGAENIETDYDDDDILCRPCQDENRHFSSRIKDTSRGTRCDRTYRLFQDPELKYRALSKGRRFLLP
jgi:hypothetical protein